MQLVSKSLIIILLIKICLSACSERRIPTDILLVQHVLDTFVNFNQWKQNPAWDIFSGSNFICHEPRLNLSKIFDDLGTSVDTIQTPIEVIPFDKRHIQEVNKRLSGLPLERISSDSVYYILRNGSAFTQERSIYRFSVFMVSDIYKVGNNYFFYIIYGVSSKGLDYGYYHYRFEDGKLILIKADSAVS
jgi:hypothetical protein